MCIKMLYFMKIMTFYQFLHIFYTLYNFDYFMKITLKLHKFLLKIHQKSIYFYTFLYIFSYFKMMYKFYLYVLYLNNLIITKMSKNK